MQFKKKKKSPKWSSSTKIIISILMLIIVVALLIRFSDLISPIIAAFILTILLYPLAEFLNKRLHISWGLAVGTIYFLTLALFISILTLGGIALIDQVQGLIVFLQNMLTDLPAFLSDITSTAIQIGPIEIDLSHIDWTLIGDQLIDLIQPILSQTGNFIADIASSALGIVGSILLTLIISYLLMTETDGVRKRILRLEIPGYAEDSFRIKSEINRIWSAFLRGQLIIFLIRTLIYFVFLGILGVRFFIGLSLLAGLGNFIPYIGTAVAWLVYFLVALFQGTTAFGLDPLPYAFLVMGLGYIVDNIYDSIFTPRIMAGVLNVHPAAVMVAALIGLNLFGVFGMILAGPLLATLILITQYVEKKLLDKDPWQDTEQEHFARQKLPLFKRIYQSADIFFHYIRGKIINISKR
ncbi:MAG TPA: AI-2E family transporter [Anaerolineae bacterium]|nr:AI-2E family transporter [Anaerolineae bacterium]